MDTNDVIQFVSANREIAQIHIHNTLYVLQQIFHCDLVNAGHVWR